MQFPSSNPSPDSIAFCLRLAPSASMSLHYCSLCLSQHLSLHKPTPQDTSVSLSLFLSHVGTSLHPCLSLSLFLSIYFFCVSLRTSHYLSFSTSISFVSLSEPLTTSLSLYYFCLCQSYFLLYPPADFLSLSLSLSLFCSLCALVFFLKIFLF